ncbi:MAG: PAS domain S-box protein [Nitrospirae bacterium]|nr:PAS domain S-box protein [Nitrospirota bacterium]
MGLDWEKIILGFKRTTRKFLEDIVENISESFIVTDLSGKIVFFNKGSEKLFLYKPEEVIGRHVAMLGAIKPNVLAEIRDGNTFRGEVSLMRKTGERFPSFVICITLRDENGRPMGMIGAARDITKEKEKEEAEREISRLKAFNENLIASLNDGLQIIDEGGHITYINQRFEEIIGYSREDIIGKHYSTFIAKEALERFTKEISIDANQDRREKMTLLGKLAGEIAHEINNPLGGLIIATQMLIEDIENKGRINKKTLLKDLKEIENDASRCRRFIGKVLNFAKMIPEEKTMLNIHNMMEDALLLVQRQAKLENINIKKVFSDKDLYIIGNSNNLQQVIINIVNNAREVILPAPGEITLKTYVKDVDRKRWACIEINDTGKGIPRDIMERIFDSFFTTKPNGTGLGLSVSKRIIEEHGGKLLVRNLPGGASFTVSLPCE